MIRYRVFSRHIRYGSTAELDLQSLKNQGQKVRPYRSGQQIWDQPCKSLRKFWLEVGEMLGKHFGNCTGPVWKKSYKVELTC